MDRLGVSWRSFKWRSPHTVDGIYLVLLDYRLMDRALSLIDYHRLLTRFTHSSRLLVLARSSCFVLAIERTPTFYPFSVPACIRRASYQFFGGVGPCERAGTLRNHSLPVLQYLRSGIRPISEKSPTTPNYWSTISQPVYSRLQTDY